VLGPENPEVGAVLENLATLLQSRLNLAAAEPLFRRSLAIYDKTLGPDHPQVGAAWSKLAFLLKASQTYLKFPISPIPQCGGPGIQGW
jgi:Tetratricopeptide repeat